MILWEATSCFSKQRPNPGQTKLGQKSPVKYVLKCQHKYEYKYKFKYEYKLKYKDRYENNFNTC